ncbi:TonB-dependent receptor [Colwellia echini]|uniref:TonB-dependent receptor n=1 Tax=Colwellia echini TaxID=1982103 RepID=A0ABY3MTJ9_9GAMM|nr:TonB-dependent receptor [Colwellia echini]TYK64514.1 TonB-dependent receptor [Colwellia echini]
MRLNKISSVLNFNKFAKANVAIFGATLASVLAMPAYAAELQTELEADALANSETNIEVIEVTGMLGSMKAGALLKRTDTRIVDAIVAEDIGKLPDNNIAEALQRIPGISISSDFGVGESVTIRGISDNRVELNGRSTSGTGRGGISLDDYPSSFLKTVEVIKSPNADMIEGALGGTVNMKTVRPLELDEALVAASIDAEYANKTENVAPKFTLSAGDNWDMGSAGTFGASFVFSYQDREIRQDEFQTKMNSLAPVDGVYEGDGASITGLPDGFVGNGPRESITTRTENTMRVKTETRERTAFGTTLQWAPESGSGNIYLDLSGSKLEGGQQAYDNLDVISNAAWTNDSFQSDSGQLMTYDLNGIFVIPKTESDFAKNNSYSHALGAEWDITDKLAISGEVSITGSKEDGVESQLNLRPVDFDAYEAAVEANGTADPGGFMNSFDAVGNYKSGTLPGLDSVQEGLYANALVDPRMLAIREMFYDTNATDNDETAARFDIEYFEPGGVSWISSVKAGVRVTSSEYSYQTATLLNKEYGSTFGDAYKKAKDADGNIIPPTSVADFNGTALISHDNLFDQAGSNGFNALNGPLYALDAGVLENNPESVWLEFQSMMNKSVNYNTTGTLLDNTYDQASEWKNIKEDTSAVYLQFALDFDTVTAVVGGRYVTTDLTSSIKNIADDAWDGTYTDGKNSYNDFLPSLNVTWSVQDDTLVRFAAAKVMRRAGYDQLSPAFDLDTTLIAGSKGSYELAPKRVTQYDLSAEHYFGEGGLVSAAIFYKDVNSFTVDTNYCQADPNTIANQAVGEEYPNICGLTAVGVDNPVIQSAGGSQAAVEAARDAGLTGVNISTSTNGGSGDVSGLELAYQQQFSTLPGAWSGLGMQTNYTYATSSQPNGLPLENISENTVNFQLYWENDDFQTRLAYNWRSEYMDDEVIGKRLIQGGERGFGTDVSRTDPDSISEKTGVSNYDPTSENSYREARGQLDFSASYDINEILTVTFNAVNLLGEHIVYTSAQDQDWRITEADVRYNLGLSAKW